MKVFTCIVIVFIISWPLAINAQDRYRDEIDRVRNKHTDEIIKYAARPCYIALLKNTDLLQYADDRKEMVEAVRESISHIAINTLINKVKGTNEKYRSDMYQRYVDFCIKKFKPTIEELVKQAKMERRLR